MLMDRCAKSARQARRIIPREKFSLYGERNRQETSSSRFLKRDAVSSSDASLNAIFQINMHHRYIDTDISTIFRVTFPQHTYFFFLPLAFLISKNKSTTSANNVDTNMYVTFVRWMGNITLFNDYFETDEIIQQNSIIFPFVQDPIKEFFLN